MKSFIFLLTTIHAQFICQQGNQTITTTSGTILSQPSSDSIYPNSLDCGFLLNTNDNNKIIKVCIVNSSNSIILTLNATGIISEFMTNPAERLPNFVGKETLYWDSNQPWCLQELVCILISSRMQLSPSRGSISVLNMLVTKLIDKSNVCSNDGECHQGTCNNGVCDCPADYYGDLCESYFSVFSPRERHAVAYDNVRDIAFVSFGLDWDVNNVKSDFMYYNFSNCY